MAFLECELFQPKARAEGETLSTGFVRAGLLVAAIGVALPGWILAARNEHPKIGFAIEAMKGERWQTDFEAFQSERNP